MRKRHTEIENNVDYFQRFVPKIEVIFSLDVLRLHYTIWMFRKENDTTSLIVCNDNFMSIEWTSANGKFEWVVKEPWFKCSNLQMQAIQHLFLFLSSIVFVQLNWHMKPIPLYWSHIRATHTHIITESSWFQASVNQCCKLNYALKRKCQVFLWLMSCVAYEALLKHTQCFSIINQRWELRQKFFVSFIFCVTIFTFFQYAICSFLPYFAVAVWLESPNLVWRMNARVFAVVQLQLIFMSHKS